MGLFDFLKKKKKKKEDAAPGSEAEEAMEAAVLDDSQLEGIEPPETRFTEEYREYLAAQEAAGEVRGPAGDGEAEAAPASKDEEREERRMKALVAYFSASGVTAGVANRLAEAVGAPVYEIRPAVPYTAEDLDWRNEKSRSSVEMKDKDCRPALADTDAPVAEAEVVFLGYPVWWYREPSLVDTFLEAYDFKGKRIVLFATSGVSPVGDEAPARAAALSGAAVEPGKRFPADVSGEELKAWAEGFLR